MCLLYSKLILSKKGSLILQKNEHHFEIIEALYRKIKIVSFPFKVSETGGSERTAVVLWWFAFRMSSKLNLTSYYISL